MNRHGAAPVDRQSAIREIFREYMENYRQFLTIAERCLKKGWPDRSSELRISFSLQYLFIQRQTQRFEHLASHGLFLGTSSAAGL
jgi:hypothetical protein